MKKISGKISRRKSTNKYNCQTCKKTQEKNRRKLRAVKEQFKLINKESGKN